LLSIRRQGRPLKVRASRRPLRTCLRLFNYFSRRFQKKTLEALVDQMPSFDRITQKPGKMGGRACIRGLRVTVSMIAELLDKTTILVTKAFCQANTDCRACLGTISLPASGNNYQGLCRPLMASCYPGCSCSNTGDHRSSRTSETQVMGSMRRRLTRRSKTSNRL